MIFAAAIWNGYENAPIPSGHSNELAPNSPPGGSSQCRDYEARRLNQSTSLPQASRRGTRRGGAAGVARIALR
jgi:hypothetical protein